MIRNFAAIGLASAEPMQDAVLLLPLILPPLLFWAGYHYYKDRHLPEPVSYLILSFALGVGSFYLGRLMYAALGLVSLRYDAFALAETNLPGLFAYSLLVIGVIEEVAKLVPFLLVVLRLEEFDEPIDGIIYASFIALGFSAVENIQYLQFGTSMEGLARGFAGPLVHIMFASIWGYHIGVAFLCGKSLAPTIFAAVGFTAFLHGIYDFVVIAMPPPALPAAALMILGIWIWRMRRIRQLHVLAEDPSPSAHRVDSNDADESGRNGD